MHPDILGRTAVAGYTLPLPVAGTTVPLPTLGPAASPPTSPTRTLPGALMKYVPLAARLVETCALEGRHKRDRTEIKKKGQSVHHSHTTQYVGCGAPRKLRLGERSFF